MDDWVVVHIAAPEDDYIHVVYGAEDVYADGYIHFAHEVELVGLHDYMLKLGLSGMKQRGG